MKTVWKFVCPAGQRAIHRVPAGARVVNVHFQSGRPCVWLLVDRAAPLEPWVTETVGTGWEIGDDAVYLGTAHDDKGHLVWHVFRVAGEDE